MLMTSFRLICFRLYNISFGRLSFFSGILRKVLVKNLITKRKDKYVASSKYFDPKELT